MSLCSEQNWVVFMWLQIVKKKSFGELSVDIYIKLKQYL